MARHAEIINEHDTTYWKTPSCEVAARTDYTFEHSA